MTDALTAMPKYEVYKESGLDWIGEIPESWELTKLGSTLKPISIKNKPELPLLSITREQGVILRDIENQDENHNFIPDDLSGYKMLEKGQFGMNKMKAWQGSYGVSKFTGIVSPAYFIFNFQKPIFLDFFHKAIRSKLYVSFFGSASDGVRIGQWDLSKSRMKAIPFLVPPIEEQTAIAKFLDRKTTQIDQAIAIKEKQIALLKERKQILIQNAVTRGLDPNVPMKDSGVEWIGELPEHWEVKLVKHVSNYVTSGPRGWSDYFTDNGAYFLQSGDLNESMGIELEFSVRVHPPAGAEGMRTRLKNGDVLICITGAKTGKVALAEIKNKEVYINQHLCLVRSVDTIDEKFLATVLYSFVGKIYFYLQQYGLKEGLGLDDVKNAFVFLPPLKEQNDIVTYIEAETKMIMRGVLLQQSQIEKLKEYKATLINSAVTGKIKVA